MDEKIKAIIQCVVEGDNVGVQEHVNGALAGGVPAGKVLNEGLIAGMAEVGRLFEEGEYFVPEMLISARAMKSAMAILKPHLTSGEVGFAGKVIIGTVKGDLHDIGKNLVAMMYKGAGFEVQDLGVDVPADKYVKAAVDGADIVGLSALLTTTMVAMKGVIESLKEKGAKTKVIIGGAPVTQNYADEVGASGYAADAASAVEIGKKLLGK